MVNVSLPLLALAMAATAATLPAVTSATTFSFSQWVEDLIAHPETALSPEEAVAAANAATVVATSAGLIKRVPTCQEGIFESAPVSIPTYQPILRNQLGTVLPSLANSERS